VPAGGAAPIGRTGRLDVGGRGAGTGGRAAERHHVDHGAADHHHIDHDDHIDDHHHDDHDVDHHHIDHDDHVAAADDDDTE
jgi:hypothetical protein